MLLRQKESLRPGAILHESRAQFGGSKQDLSSTGPISFLRQKNYRFRANFLGVPDKFNNVV